MSFWEYDEYFGREWVKDFELCIPNGREAFIRLTPDGELWVGVEDNGTCCGGSVSMNETYDNLTLEQAIELGAYLQCTIIPTLMEKENE